jgi:hypothetical protein
MTGTATPARTLALRLQDALVTHGDEITRPDLPAYLAGLFDVDRRHMLAVLFEEADAGHVELAYDPAADDATAVVMTVRRAVRPLPLGDRPPRPALCMKDQPAGWLCTRPADHEGDCE